MNKYNTKIWVPAIEVFLNNYNNNRIHSTTKEVPNKVFNKKDKQKISEVKENIKSSVKETLQHNKITNPTIKVGDSVRILRFAIDPKLRAAQLTGIDKEAKKFKAQWTEQIYKIKSINYKGGVKQIKVEEIDEILHVNEIQLVDPNKLFKVKVSSEQLKNYGVNTSKFTREQNIKKLAESKKEIKLSSKVEVSKYNLRKRKKVNYK
jgi:hypothetical protein